MAQRNFWQNLTGSDTKAQYDEQGNYTPGQIGGVTGLGRILSGVGNAFGLPYGHGDPNYDQNEAKIQIAQQQADQEFAQHLASKYMDKQKLALEKDKYSQELRMQPIMYAALSGKYTPEQLQAMVQGTLTGDGQQPSGVAPMGGGLPAGAGGQYGLPAPGSSPLAGAMPMMGGGMQAPQGAPATIAEAAQQMQGGGTPMTMTGGYMGKGGIFRPRFGYDPAVKADVANQAAARKVIQTEAPDFQQTLGALDRITELINQSPDYKPGLAGATGAKIDVALKKAGNDPFVTKYQGYLNQDFASLARKLGEKGVLTDPDIERVQKGLGAMDTPRATRLALKDEVISKMRDKATGLLQAAGMAPSEFKEQYPDVYRSLYGKGQDFTVDGKKYHIPEDQVKAFKKAKGIK